MRHKNWAIHWSRKPLLLLNQVRKRNISALSEKQLQNVAGIAIAPIEKKHLLIQSKRPWIKNIPVITFDADLENPEDRTAYVGYRQCLSWKRIRVTSLLKK